MFSDVLDSVTELFETRYEHGLHRADIAVLEQMDLVHVSLDYEYVLIDTGKQMQCLESHVINF